MFQDCLKLYPQDEKKVKNWELFLVKENRIDMSSLLFLYW